MDKKQTKNPLIQGIRSLKQALLRHENYETRRKEENSQSSPKDALRNNSKNKNPEIPNRPL